MSQVVGEIANLSPIGAYFRYFRLEQLSETELFIGIRPSRRRSSAKSASSDHPDEESEPIEELELLLAVNESSGKPEVWLRNSDTFSEGDISSFRKSLRKILTEQTGKQGTPLPLKSVETGHICEIVRELVELMVGKSAVVFALNLAELKILGLAERLMKTSALLVFLQHLLLTPSLVAFHVEVVEDYEALARMHFQTLKKLLDEDRFPAGQMVKERLGALQRATSTGTPIISGLYHPGRPRPLNLASTQGPFNVSQESESPPSHSGSYNFRMLKLGPLFGRERSGSIQRSDAENPYKFLANSNVA